MNWAWLKTEYPFEQSTIEKRNTILYITAFGILMLFFLQPFGFSPIDRIFDFLGFLTIGVLVLSINYFGFPYFFPAFFEEVRWSIAKGFLFLFYNSLIVGLWNYIFNALFIKKNVFFLQSGVEFIEILFKTIGIGLVSTAFLILVRYNFLARKYLQISQELNEKLQAQLGLVQTSENTTTIELLLENELVVCSRNDLKYVSAEGNYIALHFKNEENTRPKLFRATIKQIEEAMKGFPEFFRCHRSFIINLNAIESARGNSQGLFVKMHDGKDDIPVARPKIKFLRQYLKEQTIPNK